jgi:FAD/FMN-containing dehydrogenase
MNKSYSWGNYPKSDSKYYEFEVDDHSSIFKKNTIPYGNGRSYGDSCVSENIVGIKKYNHFLSFNKNSGLLKVQSGVLLSEILEVIIRHGWFL